MRTLQFPGTYEDAHGIEHITWQIASSHREGWARRFEIQTVVRGIALWGGDFDSLGLNEPSGGELHGLILDQTGCIHECVLTGDMPCHIETAAGLRETSVRFALDLRTAAVQNFRDPQNLKLSMSSGGEEVSVTNDWFEDGVQRLERELPGPSRLACCVTCLFSDYSPGGHGLMGLRCHRGAKAQYLAVRTKHDYWSVPVTEDVPETYICEEYQRRVPGTGYRG